MRDLLIGEGRCQYCGYESAIPTVLEHEKNCGANPRAIDPAYRRLARAELLESLAEAPLSEGREHLAGRIARTHEHLTSSCPYANLDQSMQWLDGWETEDREIIEREGLPVAANCPFCGESPSIMPADPVRDGNAWASVECVSPECPVNPRCGDGESVADDRGSNSYKASAIRLWNVRK